MGRVVVSKGVLALVLFGWSACGFEDDGASSVDAPVDPVDAADEPPVGAAIPGVLPHTQAVAYGEAPPPVCTVDGRALYVVADETALSARDVAVRSRLQRLGLRVTTESDGQIDASDQADKELIVISSSVESTLIGTSFRSTPLPLVTWEDELFDDLGMTGSAGTAHGREGGQTRISVVGGAEPFAAGLSGSVQVMDAPGSVRWGRPPPGAAIAATVDGDPSRATYFALASGGALSDGAIAPARRVGTFVDDQATGAMSPAAWSLFDTGIVWAFGGGSPPSVALLVTGDQDLTAGDAAVKARLEGLGFIVQVARQSAVPSLSLAGIRLIVITESITLGSLGTRLRSVPIPLISGDPQLYDELGMATSFGTQPNQTRIAIVDTASPLAGGLTGTPQVYSTASRVAWGAPSAEARIAATVAGNPARAALFGYEAGAAMPGLTAPARRVGLFLYQGETATAEGWTAFDASVRWAVGAGAPVSVALLVTGDQNLDASDGAIKSRLEGLGFAVQVARQSWLPSVSLAGIRVVVISRSVDSATVGDRFTRVAIPVVSGEWALFDELGMATSSNLEDNQTRIAIVDASSPLAGGLSGTPQVYSTPSSIVWATPGPTARVAATVAGNPSRAALFSYEAGAAMPGLTAPARRVGIFVAHGDAVTAQGWTAFDASIRWAVEQTPAGVPGLCGNPAACTPTSPQDVTCDGLDDDCDGVADDDYVATATTCGVGTCAATGQLACVNGATVDTCSAGTPAAEDASCDGVDNDCNGQIDEDYVATATSCGVGACAAAGQLECVDGATRDTCLAGPPLGPDTICDGVDDDCDGRVDDDFEEQFTTCGVGACTATGRLTCAGGAEHDDCQANAPAANDALCNGIDDDCDGRIDEDYVAGVPALHVSTVEPFTQVSCPAAAQVPTPHAVGGAT